MPTPPGSRRRLATCSPTRAVLRGIRNGGRVRIEVEDRGRGLGIAERAVEHAGGRIALQPGADGTVAVLELPLAEA